MNVFVEKITLDKTGILLVKPKNYSFDKIYRSAMGIYWDDKMCCLYHNPHGEWGVLRWYEQILSAVKSEYGATLMVCLNTVYENIDVDTKHRIENTVF